MVAARSPVSSRWAAYLGLLVIWFLAGCSPKPQVARYTVPKPESIETPVTPTRPAGGMPPGMGAAKAPSTDNLTFEMPAEWKEKPAGSFNLKAFEVLDGKDRVDITISLAGGDLIQNMNRWRGQIGLAEVSAAEIEAALKPLEVNGLPAQFIEVHQAEDTPNRQTIMGVVVPEGGQTWFIKLRGATSLAERERERFEAFAKSVKW
jgi:hypothetical protein